MEIESTFLRTSYEKKINFKACQKHLDKILEILTLPQPLQLPGFSFILNHPPESKN